MDEQNPFHELSTRLEALKNRLGLKIGGMDLRVHSRRESIGRGERTLLRLPDRRTLDAFLKERIEPELRAQINAGQAILRLSIDDEFAGIDLVIDPRKSPYNSGSHAAYDVPTVRNRNPLYNVLKAKARQLRAAEGITGIVVGDADSTALRDRQRNSNEVDARGIVRDFLRQYSSIGFVLILSVREKQRSFLDINTPERILHGMLEIGAGCSAGSALDAVFRSAMGVMPNPVAMPVNGALRAQEQGFGWGHHGGHQMSKNRVRISSRELMELLAGRRTIAELNEMHRWRSVDAPPLNETMFNSFDRSLKDGRLPAEIKVVKTGEDDSDDWIEFEFGDFDASISRIR